MVYYQANSASPLFTDFCGLLLKTAGLVDVMADVLNPLAARVQVAFVYGSIASNREQSDSDIDFMLVGTLTPAGSCLASTAGKGIAWQGHQSYCLFNGGISKEASGKRPFPDAGIGQAQAVRDRQQRWVGEHYWMIIALPPNRQARRSWITYAPLWTGALKTWPAPGLSADTRFVLAYDAARTLSLIVVRAGGYRPRSVGARYNTFLALGTADPAFQALSVYFDGCRMKRNNCEYDCAGVVSDTDADSLLQTVKQFVVDAEVWVKAHHRHLI